MDVCRQREITEHNLVLPNRVSRVQRNTTCPADETIVSLRIGAESRGLLAIKPSLMTFTEVETLFHEFGHGLQHMLTTVDEYEASGISNVEWDAVELPSQFMENWVYERTVSTRSQAFRNRETLPQPLFEKIIAAKELHGRVDSSAPALLLAARS
jgi:Zn-dependent oligopeptidase